MYDKPWLKNANQIDESSEKQQQKEKNGFLYHVYPDGTGPD